MKKIVVCDFDGTLTEKDTFVVFIRYACGNGAFVLGFLLYAPLLVLMILHLYPNDKAKQHVFSHFFKGMSLKTFDRLCQDFARDSQHLLRPQGIQMLQQAQADGSEILIVSASIDNWVQPFFEGVRSRESGDSSIRVIGTQVEVKDGRLTGRFLSKNCYGQEKVNRILELYPHREVYHLTAYGDSRGDKELLAFADESHYKPFR